MPPDPIGVSATLADVQGLFAAALNDPAQRAGLVAACRGEGPLASRRFDNYRTNLRASWEKALAAAHPVLQRYVGAEFFSAMSGLYGSQFPSRSGDLNQFGAELPQFLAQFAPLSDHPWLVDLARLEWAVHISHSAADGAALAADAVARMSEQALDELPVQLHPSCALIDSRWDVAALWQWHQTQDQGPWTQELWRPVTALVFRPLWKVGVRSLQAGEAAGLGRLAFGARLGDALDAACTAEPTMDVARVFAGWLRDGLLRSPELRSPELRDPEPRDPELRDPEP